MRFNLPQFIEVEDKIIGPLTLKQFLFLAMGGLLLVFVWFFFKLWLFILIVLPIAAIAASFAFLKVSGLSFGKFLSAFVNYHLKPRLYVWKKK